MITHRKLNYLDLRKKTKQKQRKEKQNKSETRFTILIENETADLTSAKT